MLPKVRTELTEGSRECARTECRNPKGTLVDVVELGGSGSTGEGTGDGEGADAGAGGWSVGGKESRADPSCDGGRDVAEAELGDR